MRGVSKPWPPADVSQDGHTPCSLRDAERNYLAALPPEAERSARARARFDQLDKRKLRVVMYHEQRSICVFCERPIDEGNPTPRIDHWRPLSVHPEHALHWRNLYLSCPSAETCDAAKGERALRWGDTDPHLPWPTDLRYEDLVGFTSRGDIYVRKDLALDDAVRRALELALDDRQNGNRTRRAILNLNHPTLVAARAAALDRERSRLERDFEDSTATREAREERANEMLAQNPLPGFVSIRVAWLRKRLGRGR
ncbi:MAG: hypothetical protein Q7W02_07625 [Candidatus Rokubacteria bacterium]|nr:hypothetical protein [Candidatus Rokubacteria bacterium]